MRARLFFANLILGLALIVAGYATAESKAPVMKKNADWVVKIMQPLEKELLACIEFTKDPAQVGKVDPVVNIYLEINADGMVTNFGSNIKYPGTYVVKPCFNRLIYEAEFPAKGQKSNQHYQFKISE
jgi:hypothetical protein